MSFEITRDDLSALAFGSSVLACGGGGNPYYAQLVAREALAKSGPVTLIGLDELEPEALTLLCANVGAPLVGIERAVSLRALQLGYRTVERAAGDRIRAFVAAEVGGSQSLLPVLLASLAGRPIIDGDFMGRAFPEAQMCTFMIYGATPGVPAAFFDEHEVLFDFPRVKFMPGGIRVGGTGRAGRLFGIALERVLRRYTARKGGWIYSIASIDKPSLERTLVRGSMSHALAIGRGVAAARERGDDPIAAVLEIAGGRSLFRGKISDVERRFHRAHDWGTLPIEGLDAHRGQRAEVSFKNEYLVLRVEGEVVLTVPDLISLVESESGHPVTTEVLRPGLRVDVLGFRCSPLYRTPEALRVVGPKGFGYDLPFVPLCQD